ncbi:MAG: tRNA uridine-5-carboxymethylaminomethyl(34) synthesis GTPase MnmE, partial [Eubacterium sp.]|nr:tRNA uridine-5-carboxymethylaminomethyl(34) synthesis GTPase MnmE [Eubacterium sp.]
MSETIAAIATASGSGSISILRVSGPESVAIVDDVFFQKNKMNGVLSKAASHTIHYGWIGESVESVIDEVLVLLMRAPRSYTAEDVVEIHCHGGGMAAKSILDFLIEKGVRLAEPGEFTKRAFLNGRIDLTQAESVMEVIRAKSELALSTAEEHLRGDVRSRVEAMREVVLSDMAYLEAALDDPEHIELTDYPQTLLSHLAPIDEELTEMLHLAENGRRISEGIRTAIIGRPNVGKSSFLNRILREDRAIVTDVPGTTRDTLEEDVWLGGILLRLIDTAGLRETSDLVENIGVEKAREAYASADFLICVLDASE